MTLKTELLFILPPPFIDGSHGFHPRGSMPTNIVTLATYIKKHTPTKIKIIDCFLQNIPLQNILKIIKTTDPKIIAIPFAFTERKIAYQTIFNLYRNLKKYYPAKPIILFNWYYDPAIAHILNNESVKIDYLLMGDIEPAFVQLLNCIKQHKEPINVPGLIYEKNSKLRENPQKAVLKNLDDLPIPDWSLLNFKNYSAMPHRYNKINFYPMSISRGCTWNKCVFCQESFNNNRNLNLNYRYQSPQRVVNEIVFAVKKYKVQEIQFDCPQFPVNINWLEAFNLHLEKYKIPISWSCLSRINNLNKFNLRLMKKAGCSNILLGIESFDHKLLKKFRKGHSYKQILTTIKNCRETGIETTGSFLMGLPGEKPLNILKTAWQAANIGIDYFQLFIVKWYSPPPNIYNHFGKLSNYWDYSKFDFYGPIFVPKHYLNINHMKLIQAFAYLCFYLHPLTIFRRLSRIKNFKDLKRIFNGAWILFQMVCWLNIPKKKKAI